jgi:cytidylate kinase
MPWKLSTDSRITARAFERQMSNWELARLQRLEKAEAKRLPVEDFVTISREVGVRGEEVAHALSTKLGWPVFGKNLLEAMAGNNAVRHQIYSSMDERDMAWWEETLRSLLDQQFTLNDYFHRLCETVFSLARQSSCVFVGRGCDLILPSQLGFRVRLVAPLDQRLERLANEKGLSPENAERELKRIGRERSEFLRHHFRVAPEDPTRHDLTINLERTTVDQAADTILAAREIRIRPLAATVSA